MTVQGATGREARQLGWRREAAGSRALAFELSLVGCFPNDPASSLLAGLDWDLGSGPFPSAIFAARGPQPAIAGEFADIGFEDLIELLALARKSGQLVLHAGSGEARLLLADGEIVQASYAGTSGEEAVYRVVGEPKSRFEFFAGEQSGDLPGPRLRMSSTRLLLESARREDESRRLTANSAQAPTYAGPPAEGADGRSEEPVGADSGLPRPGSTIDKYRVEAEIGRGAFGIVFKATHLLLRTPVALKFLRWHDLRRDPAMTARLCEEARFAALVNHPNVVRVFDVTHDASVTYIVMEYIDGPSLLQAIRQAGRLPVTCLLELARAVALGLRAALAQGLLHRDIKPANILLPQQGDAKIVDLGLAHGVSSDTNGARVGTPTYMAPESFATPGRVDFRADVYSLGRTLLHAAVGRLSPADRPAFDDPPHELPGEFWRLLAWMLQEEPDDRPSSYDQLLAGIAETKRALAQATGHSVLSGADGALFGAVGEPKETT